MTEDELRTMSEFDDLPYCSSISVELCDQISRSPSAPGFTGEVRGAITLQDAQNLLRDSNYRAAGAIRDEQGQVEAFFWRMQRS
jgi:hypothetical protein